DGPLRKSGTMWRIASRRDAWFLLARGLTGVEISRFKTVFTQVMGAIDPRFHLEPGERWLAGVRNIRPSYSSVLRRGLTETAMLMTTFGEQVESVPALARTAEHLVRELLSDAPEEL